MRDPETFEARLNAAFSRYADQVPTDVDIHALVEATRGTTRTPGMWLDALPWRDARGRPGIHWPLVLVLLGVAAATALAGALAVLTRPISTFPTGSIAFVRDGVLSVAASDGRGAVGFARVDRATGDQIPAFAFAPDARHLAWVVDTLDSRDVNAGGNLTSDMTIATPDGRAQTSIAGCCYGFGWAPDGQRLAVFSDHRLAIIGIDGQRKRLLALPDGFDYDHFLSDPHDMPWSLDGRWIAIRGCHTTYPNCKLDWDWLLVAADGSGAHWLHPDPSAEDVHSFLAWAPDSTLALTYESRASIETQDTDGTTVQELPLPAGWVPTGPPDWSPDATRLVVPAGKPKDGVANAGGFAVVGLDGTSEAFGPLTVDDGSGEARWAADGTHVLWTGEIDPTATPGMTLWSTDVANGSTPTRLANGYIDAFDVVRGSGH